MARAKKQTEPDKSSRRRIRIENVADWERANGELLRSLISAVGAMGGAVRFGYSRDGGAYSIGLYGDGEPYTEYLSGDGAVDDWLLGFTEDYS
jgi:hypothetical protein